MVPILDVGRPPLGNLRLRSNLTAPGACKSELKPPRFQILYSLPCSQEANPRSDRADVWRQQYVPVQGKEEFGVALSAAAALA